MVTRFETQEEIERAEELEQTLKSRSRYREAVKEAKKKVTHGTAHHFCFPGPFMPMKNRVFSVRDSVGARLLRLFHENLGRPGKGRVINCGG